MGMPAMKCERAMHDNDALARLPEAPKSGGFGVRTEIAVHKTLKQKMNGACNPALVHRALESDVNVGVRLPCDVIAYEAIDGHTVVSAVEPIAAIGSFGGEQAVAFASDVKEKLSRAVESSRGDAS
ncbi:MAG: DUF302 domain-containing protein [Myxococcales bacterium FL481]|nr:MAG: DUF302 domain-containing protein [Myxococcales bacterium FL481]